jgi:ribonucleoside-diphosphate reductase alpha chain
MEGIFEALKEGALTMQQGGGVGYDFSTLRPRGSCAKAVGGIASGPVSFMEIWDCMCATLLSTGARRGAMMATLRCDHPDVETFIEAKRRPGRLRHFNLSLLVSDELMQAVREDRDWPLLFPLTGLDPDEAPAGGQAAMRVWSGSTEPTACRVFRVVRARDLWEKLVRASYEYAEPGVLFVDRINRSNNLRYCERISATNPCGEIPLPPYGACDLGSVNLTRFVLDPFSEQARLDMPAIERTVAVAVRLLDNVIDVSGFPLAVQRRAAAAARRIGLGVTGLADALIMLGLDYGSVEARNLGSGLMKAVCLQAYRASLDLAREKGAFPLFRAGSYLDAPFVRRLPESIRTRIAATGIRNSHLLAIAPAGTISLLADNVSSGIEPVFALSARRRMLDADGAYVEKVLEDYALARWRAQRGGQPLPGYFVTADRLPPEAHLEMQAALQPWVDSAISKTINVPADQPFERFAALYDLAYDLGLKGCTTFRPNPVTEAVLRPAEEPDPSVHCCGLEREAD